MKTFQNKKALITGAAQGIGQATALEFARRGAHLALLDRKIDKLAETRERIVELGGSCLTLECDLAVPGQIESACHQVISQWGGLDVLVNNAGISHHGPTHELTPEERDRILQVNLVTPFALFQHLVHHLMNAEAGHLVNISSIFGLVPHQQTAAYSVSKYGLVGLSESLRAEYGRWGLGVTTVCPGFVQTPMIENLPDRSGNGQKLRKPARWLMTTPEKVARKIAVGVLKNRRLILATPLAHFLYHSKRLAPGLFDRVQNFKSSHLTGWMRRSRKPAATSRGSTTSADSRKAA